MQKHVGGVRPTRMVAGPTPPLPGAAQPHCHPITHRLAHHHAHSGTLFVTFSNKDVAEFAVNWARRLHAIRLSGVVGTADFIVPRHAEALRAAGVGIFCASSDQMKRNGQAGRWTEVAPLLRFGLNILVSDADIAWVRSPLPYFKAVRRRHPAVDFLLCTDKAHNNLQSKPLFAPTERHGSSRQGGGRRLGALEHRNRSSWAGVGRNRSSLAGVGRLRAMYGDLIGTQRAEGGEGRGRPKRANATGELSPTSGDLDLEHGVHSAIPSYNIGILMLYAHANASLAAMIGDLWTAAVLEPETDRNGKKIAQRGGLSAWDQGPINKRVLQGMAHPRDPQLVLVDRPLNLPNERPTFTQPLLRNRDRPRVRLAMGVLPMLQFSTAFNYFIQGDRRKSLNARPYSLHAIYSHGKDAKRKKWLLREAQLWHDPPSYYEGRWLTYDVGIPERARRQGGFDLILTQLKAFEVAVHVAALANRTLILPRLECGDAMMAYPCYAWYHRAMMMYGWRHDKIPMPNVCPTYYWLSHGIADDLNIDLREPSFLSNPRTPPIGPPATLRFCHAGSAAEGGCGRPRAAASASASAASDSASSSAPSASAGDIVSPARTTSAQLRRALDAAAGATLLHVSRLSELTLDGGGIKGPAARVKKKHTLGGGLEAVSGLSSGYWCTMCVLTRRGGVIQEINHSSVIELENFCRAEARGNLGVPGARQTCCTDCHPVQGCAGGCPACTPKQASPANSGKMLRNEANLSWEMSRWMPAWASQKLAREGAHGRAAVAGFGHRDLQTHYRPHNRTLAVGGGRSGGSGGGGGGGRASLVEADAHFSCQHPLCTLMDRKNFP